MSSIFDGAAGLIRGVLGGTVTIYPYGVPTVLTTAVFREEPMLASGGFEEAQVTVVQPFLRADRRDVVELKVGDVVDPHNGKTYRVVSDMPQGSPADDATVEIELEKI